jgi:hypothetical protein
MARATKVFSGTSFYRNEALGIERKQHHILIVATTKKEATAMIGTSMSDFNHYFGETGNETELKIASGHTSGMWVAPLNSHASESCYIKVK